ncbi:PREDICTED: uncharacterized protein LOC108566356 [Nicrophorus vespilloides]|uniref:Uncharacterized protein LOC108566356 n=1 Tax=Nicrophorus vespilloides TaxID=110193 RepID=A0ABM1N4D4_NICVS|nr:PREDICTED: uncharacterized protein LOC108566356 [Nicrophorus vespilloides]
MKTIVLCLYIFIGIIISSTAQPYGYRLRRSYPHQAMMFSGGFYGRPGQGPQGSMTAFASRDAIATNSYLGGNEYLGMPIDESADDSNQVHKHPDHKTDITETEQTEGEEEEELEYTTTVKPKKIPAKRKHVIKSQEDEDDEEDTAIWPLQGSRNGYNAFFPIFFGTRGSSHRSSESGEGYNPGSATAIANSFSTGKGGVATSHATAYGDPYLSVLLRNGGNVKRRNSKNDN